MRALFGTTLAALTASVLGIALFFVKHEVRDQEARLTELNREIRQNQEASHVLKAEWSYLNDPARLRQLSEKYLDMRVMQASQVTTWAALRPAPGSTAVAAVPRPPQGRPGAAVAESRPPAGDLR
mgnify:CR=1 FL=1